MQSRLVWNDYKDCIAVFNASKQLQSLNDPRNVQQRPQFRHGWRVHNVGYSQNYGEKDPVSQVLQVVQKCHSAACFVRVSSRTSRRSVLAQVAGFFNYLGTLQTAERGCLSHSHMFCVMDVTTLLSRTVLWSCLPTTHIREHFIVFRPGYRLYWCVIVHRFSPSLWANVQYICGPLLLPWYGFIQYNF